jgi:heme oxygenase
MAWKSIIEEWRGSITEEAIAEAVRLAREAFQEHADASLDLARSKVTL